MESVSFLKVLMLTFKEIQSYVYFYYLKISSTDIRFEGKGRIYSVSSADIGWSGSCLIWLSDTG